MPDPVAVTLPVLLYDGTCPLCTMSVRFVLAREREQVLRFAPLDGATARAVRQAHPELDGIDSLVLVEGDRVLVRSAAALELARYLRWPWPLARVALMVPRPVRDWLYDRVARHRHRLVRPAGPVVFRDDDARFLP